MSLILDLRGQWIATVWPRGGERKPSYDTDTAVWPDQGLRPDRGLWPDQTEEDVDQGTAQALPAAQADLLLQRIVLAEAAGELARAA